MLCHSVVGYTARREVECDNNSCSSCTFTGTRANVYVAEVQLGCVHPGSLVSIRIPYGNNGNAAATNVIITNILPLGLTFSAALPEPTSVDGQSQTWSSLGTIPGSLGCGRDRRDHPPGAIG